MNACESVENMWVEDDPKAVSGMKSGICKPSGKDSRLIILHTDSENGWVNGFIIYFCLTYCLTH